MNKFLIKASVQATLSAIAFFARRPRLQTVSYWLTHSLARLTVRTKRIGQARSLAELGPLWQQSFPSRKQVPIELVTRDTVYAQILTPCPLRGSGDLQACHRMMQFDRSVVAHAGGQFVVLESQATPGVTRCRVAMRLNGQSLDDLVAAHERVDA
jgi:hypothetical protein